MGAWVFPIFEYDEIFRFILDRNIRIERTISDRVGIADAPDAFERFEKRLTEKVMFVWDESHPGRGWAAVVRAVTVLQAGPPRR